MSTCALDECSTGGKLTRGWCQKHYQRWKRHGDPRFLAHLSLVERFHAAVSPGRIEDCWPWTGSLTSGGYGRIRTAAGDHVAAHRLAWTLAHGPIPDGLHVLHHCDYPPCCNPYGDQHLFLGTHSVNMDDRDGKDRVRHGSSHPRAKIVEADVIVIRARLATGESQRSVARDYPISMTTIGQIARGESWRRVRTE
jgi:hypothetical protein